MGAEATTATNVPDDFHAAGRPDPGAARSRAAELFALHGRLVEGLCRALLRDPVEAEDAAQQVFLSAYRALLAGASVREPAAWLATIARNECASRARTRMREPLALDADEAASFSDPVAEAIRRADLRALWTAVSALPAQQRDALLMREFAGLSYAELAAALAVSEPAVESLLSRARTKLRGQLSTVFASLGGISSAPAAVGRLLGGVGSAKLTAAAVSVAVVAGGASFVDRHPAPSRGPVSKPARTHAVLRPTVQVEALAPVAPVVQAAAPRVAQRRLAPAAAAPRHAVRQQRSRSEGRSHDSSARDDSADRQQAEAVVRPAPSGDGESDSGEGRSSQTAPTATVAAVPVPPPSTPAFPGDDSGDGSGDGSSRGSGD